jgi:hypothetical protein
LFPLLFVLVPCSCVQQPSAPGPLPELESASQPIIGGQPESGWEGVGALTFVWPGYGYMGSYCSGTLIAPQWVLTAAHCLTATESEGMELFPEIVSFFVGPDANPEKWGQLPEGKLFQADKFIPHPNYNPTWISSDIGLLHLAEPADGVPFYPINTKELVEEMIGTELLYVGYGVNNGVNQHGGGVKRSAKIALAAIDEKIYYSEFKGTGICFGDSGGPGLMLYPEDGTWHVTGVNSFVGGEGGSMDPCKDVYGDTRVDVFQDWVNEHINGPALVCTDDPSLCWCPEACKEGVCDNEVCKTTDCKHLYWCLAECGQDAECSKDCYVVSTDEANKQLGKLLGCMYQKCGWLDNEAWEVCVETSCKTQHDTCLPEVTGDASCAQVHGCIAGCAGAGYTCQMECAETGTAEAKAQLSAMYGCISKFCGDEPMTTYLQCVSENCSAEKYACLPPAGCSPSGGDCAEGYACFPAPTGVWDCFETEGFAMGDACDPKAEFPLHCADGLVCHTAANELSTCSPLCADDKECKEDEVCKTGILAEFPEAGTCVCRDDDEDGWCATDECDDGNDLVNPSLGELCDDGLDNDCDGQTDEGCDPPVPDETGEADVTADAVPEMTALPPSGGSSSGCAASPTPPRAAAALLAAAALAFFALARRRSRG